jgi:alpha-glucosidase (family GH31 glycosyl hydrolase)
MYPLGNQFKVDYTKARSDDKAVVKGSNFRISVITERVVRLEFSPSGQFIDRPTQLVSKRNLGLAEFNVRQDTNIVEINSRYFALTYIKRTPFAGNPAQPTKNLKITLNSREPDRVKDWYYGHPEIRNMGGNIVGVDMPLDRTYTKGLYSLDGFASIDDSNSLIIMEDGTLASPPTDHTDIYVFMYDRDFKQALFDYFKMTGTPSLIPRYAFGNWWSRNITYDDESTLALIKRFEKKKIPLAIMLFDHDWHYRNVKELVNLKTGYTFNNKLFKDPKAMISQFHNRGIRVGVVIDPTGGFYPHEQFYKQASEYLGIADSKIILFDPFNPKLIDVYFKVFLHPLEALGVDFFWNDYKGSNDIRKLWAVNHYMYLDAGRNTARRSMFLARNGLAAPHRYPICYGGSSEVSWEALKELPFLYINAANAGISFVSHDVGGNHGGIEDRELYIRYLELSVFEPILRFHGARGVYYKREPWLWDVETESIAAEYLRLRHRLIPYLYTEAYNYTKSGTTLVQPFYYNYLWCYDDDLYRNQYYFGSQLLVCPILEKKDNTMNRTIHRFFIPDGIWYDFNTGKKFPGNHKYVSFFKEEDYPVFAHAGSIIPLSNRSDYNNVGLPTDLEIQIFPGVSNTYTLYEDDGVTSLYKEGYYLKTSIDYNYLHSNYTVIVRSIDGKSGIVPERRNYKFVFRNTKEPTSVTAFFNNQNINVTGKVDENDYVVEVNGCPTIGQLTINCKGKDIEIDAIRLINDDVDSILTDLKIGTYLKEDIAAIMFDTNTDVAQKRIAIRKLKKRGLSKEYMNLFLKLLEYIGEV